MVSTAKRLSAGVFALVWAVLSIVLPVSAHAATYNAASNLTGRAWYVPATGTGLAGSAVVATAATMLSRANPWVAALTLGTPIMQFLLDKADGSKVGIRAPNAPVATPSGWTTGPNGIPIPPSQVPITGGSTYPAQYYQTGGYTVAATQGVRGPGAGGTSVVYDTLGDACNAVRTYPYGVLPKGSCTDTSSGVAWNNGGTAGLCYYNNTGTNCAGITSDTPIYAYKCPSGMSYNGTVCANTQPFYHCSTGTLSGTTCTVAGTCPVGYAVSQGFCTVVDPTAVKWPSDGIPFYVPSLDGGTLVADPRDPDVVPATPTPSQLQNPSGDYFPDPYGNPTSIQITPQVGGGYKIDQRVQTTNNNQTSTTINNLTINNNGIVVDASSRTVTGPIVSASPTGTVANPSVDFPTDYNREATQQQAVQKLDDIKTGAGAADAPDYQVSQKKADMNQEIKDKADAVPSQYSADKSNWFSWVWTPPIGHCQPWESTIHGQSMVWNFCPYIEKIRDVIGYMLAVSTAIAVYFQLFRRNDD